MWGGSFKMQSFAWGGEGAVARQGFPLQVLASFLDFGRTCCVSCLERCLNSCETVVKGLISEGG